MKLKVDFHVHTSNKDGLNTAWEMASYARRKGLNAIAITDHDTLTFKKPIETAKGFLILNGVELSTDKGHLIVLGADHLPALHRFEEILDWVRDNNFVAFAPHLYDKSRNGLGDIGFEKLDIIEVVNGRTYRKYNEKATYRAFKYNKIGVSNSDAHAVWELGKYYTEVFAEDYNAEEILEALRKGKVKARLTYPSNFEVFKNRVKLKFAKVFKRGSI